ncbi:MAG TPA: hypothetical protein H9962_09250 [Candidatus Mailhella merdigallinarum]|uniref:Uncharacterized protein n=1 Tax=Candidatus Mailhella merdigallinarum TaxID=2838658 RepID=A0A9D2HFS6_9BACT|nr:hypothetical protein [Candidatus Mailhella merdigallinarum]
MADLTESTFTSGNGQFPAHKAVTVILTDFTPLLLNYIFHIVISFLSCQKAADFDWTLCRLWGTVWGR